MKCPKCEGEVKEGDRFCSSCGAELEEAAEPVVVSEGIPDTSRLSGVGIEKFLMPGEHIKYVTSGPIWYANSQRTVYVTNRRLLFYKREKSLLGLVKQDRLDEIDLKMIRRCILKESGLITKKIYLELDEIKLEGERGELLKLYKAIQGARAAL